MPRRYADGFINARNEAYAAPISPIDRNTMATAVRRVGGDIKKLNRLTKQWLIRESRAESVETGASLLSTMKRLAAEKNLGDWKGTQPGKFGRAGTFNQIKRAGYAVTRADKVFARSLLRSKGVPDKVVSSDELHTLVASARADKAVKPLTEKIKSRVNALASNYNNQPRDDHGRWTK